jgi:hypothetical protein
MLRHREEQLWALTSVVRTRSTDEWTRGNMLNGLDREVGCVRSATVPAVALWAHTNGVAKPSSVVNMRSKFSPSQWRSLALIALLLVVCIGGLVYALASHNSRVMGLYFLALVIVLLVAAVVSFVRMSKRSRRD